MRVPVLRRLLQNYPGHSVAKENDWFSILPMSEIGEQLPELNELLNQPSTAESKLNFGLIYLFLSTLQKRKNEKFQFV